MEGTPAPPHHIYPLRTLFAYALALGMVAGTLGCQKSTAPPFSPTTVRHTMTSAGHQWTAAFDVQSLNEGIVIVLRIDLIPVSGTSFVELETAMKQWELFAEKVWSQNHLSFGSSSQPWPIRLDVQFEAQPAHHRVVVRDGNGPTDQQIWYLRDPLRSVAHEVGHMLGAYDEYQGGAVDPRGAILDPTSIMSRGDRAITPYTRHWHVLDRFLANLSETQRPPVLKTLNAENEPQ